MRSNQQYRFLIDELLDIYPKNHVNEMIREISFAEKSVLMRDLYTFSENCEIKERFVSYIKPLISGTYIRLGEVCLMSDFNVWKVGVSESIHVNHFGIEVKVYLIDFTSERTEKEFWINFVMG